MVEAGPSVAEGEMAVAHDRGGSSFAAEDCAHLVTGALGDGTPGNADELGKTAAAEPLIQGHTAVLCSRQKDAGAGIGMGSLASLWRADAEYESGWAFADSLWEARSERRVVAVGMKLH